MFILFLIFKILFSLKQISDNILWYNVSYIFIIINNNLESNLVYIKSNLTILVEGINQLQTESFSLLTVLKIIEDIEESFKLLRGEAGTIVKKKFETVFENNNGLSTLKLISKV